MYYLRHPMYKCLGRFRRIYNDYKFEIMEMSYLNWSHWFQMDFEKFEPGEDLQPSKEAPSENPDLFMIVHPEMKINYLRYGDVCYLTVI